MSSNQFYSVRMTAKREENSSNGYKKKFICNKQRNTVKNKPASFRAENWRVWSE